jgi:hypothetical protein
MLKHRLKSLVIDAPGIQKIAFRALPREGCALAKLMENRMMLNP